MESKVLLTVLCMLPAVFRNASGELSSPYLVSNKVQSYKALVNRTLLRTKLDKELHSAMIEEHQLQIVNVTAAFRMQMMKHREHSFTRPEVDRKWTNCMDFYSTYANSADRQYYENEEVCLKNCNQGDKDKRQAVDQIEREIKNWRKSFKYLSHLCEVNYSGDPKGIRACLVDYIEKDNYISTLYRLMQMKVEAMTALHEQLDSTIQALEECLKPVLSSYLDRIRKVMENLNRCYTGSVSYLYYT